MLFTHGERLLIRAACSSFSSRVRSKLARLFDRADQNPAKYAGPAQPWITLTEPSITGKEMAGVMDAVLNGWNNTTHVRNFEHQISNYVGTRFALATSSCTGALHLALRAIGIGPGDEVLVPETTYIATASTVIDCGATPVTVDVDPESWCMDPESARRAITSRTRAILPVHEYGHPADMPAILKLAKEYNLKVIEDAAGAIGTTIDGRHVGTFGDAAAFSFHVTKMITSGEGGMLVTSDEFIFHRAVSIAKHGQDPKDQNRATEFGLNYRMSHLEAAIGMAQLGRIEELLAKKRLIYSWYEKHLRNVKGVTLHGHRSGTMANDCIVAVMLDDPIDQKYVLGGLKERQIDSQPAAPPLSSMPMFQSCEASNPVAYRIGRHGLLFPSGLQLVEQDIKRICAALAETLQPA